MTTLNTIKKFRTCLCEMSELEIISADVFDNISTYLDKVENDRKAEKREKNKLAQRRYYEKHKDKIRAQNLGYYHKTDASVLENEKTNIV